MNNKKFTYEISSDLDYEDLVANILYEQETVAIISQDEGNEKMQIQIFSSISNDSWMFYLGDFLNIIESAKNKLLKMRKIA